MRKTIQQAIVETAQGLRDAGVMGEVTLRELKALSLPPVKALSPTQIRNIRRANYLSQASSRACSTRVCRPSRSGKPGARRLEALRSSCFMW